MLVATRWSYITLASDKQSIYNLATLDIERELIPACQAYGIGILAWGPLHRGVIGSEVQWNPIHGGAARGCRR